MAIMYSDVFPQQQELNDEQLRLVTLAETAIDALLQLQGVASLQLACTGDGQIRQELEDRYHMAGWYVQSVRLGNSLHYFIDVYKPHRSQ